MNHFLFDAYLAVDWSASGTPKRGKIRSGGASAYGKAIPSSSVSSSNPPTRSDAYREIRETLREALATKLRLLVGFDFPYGYPAGFAAALGLEGIPWRSTWAHLAGAIKDAATNEK